LNNRRRVAEGAFSSLMLGPCCFPGEPNFTQPRREMLVGAAQ
jgi:hypothetical protein